MGIKLINRNDFGGKLVALMMLAVVTVWLLKLPVSAAQVQGQDFVPFRSYIVTYVTAHSGECNQNVVNQWLRLYDETSSNSEFSNIYYDNYINKAGESVSTQGKSYFFNNEFDGYLAETMVENQGMLGDILGINPAGNNVTDRYRVIYDTYMKDYKEHPDWTNAVIHLTANGGYIGAGKGDVNNQLEPLQKDIPMVVLLANNWDRLSETQRAWVKTYISYLFQDYLEHHDDGNAIAAPGNNDTLYDLIARSEEAANNDAYRKEFFDYVVGTGHGLGEFISKIPGAACDGLDGIQSIEQLIHSPEIMVHLLEHPVVRPLLEAYNLFSVTYSWGDNYDTCTESLVYANDENIVYKTETVATAKNSTTATCTRRAHMYVEAFFNTDSKFSRPRRIDYDYGGYGAHDYRWVTEWQTVTHWGSVWDPNAGNGGAYVRDDNNMYFTNEQVSVHKCINCGAR